MTAVLDEIATTLAGRVGVASLNLDQNPIATARLGILGIPTLILFRDGREVDRMIGARGKEDILLKLAAVNGRAP
jgi:thioredoxin-like negative regulator of GroEL